MEPLEINGGRFYARPLHMNNRINDLAALQEIFHDADENLIAQYDKQWQEDLLYTWAICEQTNVDMVAFLEFNPLTKELHSYPVGDPHRILPNTDPQLRNKTVADSIEEISSTIKRWAESVL